jgi:hypothetical protein
MAMAAASSSITTKSSRAVLASRVKLVNISPRFQKSLMELILSDLIGS